MKPNAAAYSQRLLKARPPLTNACRRAWPKTAARWPPNSIAVHCGWGRLLIGHTFPDPASLAGELLNEQPGERDIALYVAAPQQILGIDPQQLFLDPSDTLRLWFSDYRPATRVFRGFRIRRVQSEADWQAVNQLYQGRGMLPVDAERLTPRHQGGPVYWLAEDEDSGAVIGSVMGLNHQKAFHDPENGCSLWCLAVDPLCTRPGVGEVLVRHLVEHFMSRGLSYLDLSVLHDNRQAKGLYAKLGFRALTTFAIKHKNGINQPLFLGPGPQAGFNPYARIIVEEAHRRGIDVQVDDADAGLFTLSHGGRRVRCRESLSDLTSAISMTLCQDKSLTHKVLKAAGLQLPSQQLAGSADENLEFLDEHQRVVVKPLDGEQGQGVAVDLQTIEEVQQAIENARQFDNRVLLESFHEGLDLRILVIGFEVVAAAIRRPAEVTGDGQHSIRALIEAQSRRRQAATDGESKIPLDAETERTLAAAGYDYSSVLPRGLNPGGTPYRQPAHRRLPGRCHRDPASHAQGRRRARRPRPGHPHGGPGPAGARRRSTRVRIYRGERTGRPGQP